MGDQTSATSERTRGVSDFFARKQREREEAKAKAESASAGSSETRGTANAGSGQESPRHKVVVEDQTTTGKDNKRGRANPKQTVPPESPTPVLIPSTQARDMLIFMFNSMAAMTIGEYARLTEQEHKAIAEPLERLLKRMPGEAADKFGQWADPLMLIMGFGMWGYRVFVQIPKYVEQERAKATMGEYEKSISRDINLDPTQPTTKPKPSEQRNPQAGMKTPAETVETNTNGATPRTDMPTGIRADMQNLWEQKLDDG